MRRLVHDDETHAVKTPAPFAWLLLSAAFASLSALVLVRWPAPQGGQAGFPVVEASADSYELLTLFGRSATPVTNSQPTVSPPSTAGSAPASAVAAGSVLESLDAVATPPVADAAAAPPAPVATLPSGVRAADVAEHQPGKEASLFDLVNAARLAAGTGVLDRDADLDAVAFARASNLVQDRYFDHYAPDGTSAFSELAARGLAYRLAGENLARNNYPSGRTVQAAFEGLMASEGHRANILEPRFGAIGIAAVRSGGFWLYVMVFTNPR